MAWIMLAVELKGTVRLVLSRLQKKCQCVRGGQCGDGSLTQAWTEHTLQSSGYRDVRHECESSMHSLGAVGLGEQRMI